MPKNTVDNSDCAQPDGQKKSENISRFMLDEFLDYVETSTGLHFSLERHSDVKQKLLAAVNEFGFSRADEFLDWLKGRSLSAAQMEFLAGLLTVGETYFWREPAIFRALEEKILPDLIRRKESLGRTLRIWSAGCSSGEEAYSLAIAVKRSLFHRPDWNVNILATDLNASSLRKATGGIYTDWSFRNAPKWLKEGYFRSLARGRYAISPAIHKMVNFAPLNLATDKFPDHENNTASMDIIFCRNVLMYFSPDAVRQITEKFCHCMLQESIFVVSASELSIDVARELRPWHIGEAIVFRKVAQGENLIQETPTSAGMMPGKTETADSSPASWSPGPTETTLCPVLQPTLPCAAIPEIKTVEIPAANDQAGQIEALADQGRLLEALTLCDSALESHKLDARLHYLKATILQEFGKLPEATEELKKALYLHPDYFMGHFAMGNLMLRLGKNKAAARSFTNVIDLIAGFAHDAVLPESGGLTAGRLREIIQITMRSGGID